MSRGLSTTILPVATVGHAALDAVKEIEAARKVIQKTCEADWIRSWRSQHPIKSMFTDNGDILAQMPEYHMLWKEHREGDEATLRAMAGLCAAAVDRGADFTIQTTADDFRLIQKHYDKDRT